jgi:ELWxxDGT repeat protein
MLGTVTGKETSLTTLNRILSFGALALLASLPLSSQTAYRVRDLATSDQSPGASSDPRGLYALGGKVFFTAKEASAGRELWASDGTGGGTEMLADAAPGPADARLARLGSANGIVFSVSQVITGGLHLVLWRSDGTRAGTFALTAPESVDLGSDVEDVRYAFTSRRLVFTACTAEAGCEPWSSDGTAAGTHLVTDLTPGPDNSSIDPAALGGKVLFLKKDDFGEENSLWSTDGTAAGTVRVKDLGAGSPGPPTVAGNHLFFLFATESDGQELWASDGTAAGTRQVTHFTEPAPFAPFQGFLKASGQRVYFLAEDAVHGTELWRSDGTVAGTQRLTDFAAAEPFPNVESVNFVEETGDRAVFIAGDGTSVPKLWTSRGAPQTVTALPVPCGGACEFLSRGAGLVKIGDRIVFPAGDGVHGREIWATDGTPGGTRMLRDTCAGTCDGVDPDFAFAALPGMILFEVFTPQGPQAWRTDGTPDGTKLVSGAPSLGVDFEAGAALVGSSLFVAAGDFTHGRELWVSDGGGPLRLVADVARDEPSSDPADFAAFQGRLYATAGDDFRRDVWRSDGTEAGTVPVTSGPSFESFQAHHLTAAGSWLYFLEGDSGIDLWRTDGTPGGALKLASGVFPNMLASYHGRAWFLRQGAEADHAELWSSDGSPASTVQVASLPAGFLPQGTLAVEGDLLYFPLTLSSQRQLWRSDGTTAGTREAAAFSHDDDGDPQVTRAGSHTFFLDLVFILVTDGTPAGTRPLVDDERLTAQELAALGGTLLFAGKKDGSQGLWRSDGTAAGTSVVQEFVSLEQLTAADGRLFFVADDGIHGAELWTSDGTAAGTRLVRDVAPGLDASLPQSLTPLGQRLFFTAWDSAHGFEMWQTDGTEAGTRRVQDIAPGAASSTPASFTAVGDTLFFSADDGATGRELWALPLAGPAGCQPAPSRLCLNGGRYQVEAVWRDFQGGTGRGTAVPLTADTGTFWFFDPANVEAVIKVLDGQGVNGHVWVFYGALSNVEYTLTVTDTQTGLTRSYHNPSGQFASAGDTHAFGPLGAYATSPPLVTRPSPPPLISVQQAAAAPCQPGAQRLCLNGNRFAVEVAWKDFQGHTGQGTAVPLTADTGTFWFFNAANVELVLKVLDGRPLNGKFWVFYGALSNVEYTITVTDTQTGTVRTYNNPSGRFASAGDTSAF